MKEAIAIIGAGNMGAAFYKGISRELNRVRINVCDHNIDKLKALDAEHTYTDPRKAIAEASVVLLAVKPQSAKELLESLSPALKDHFVISVMAGISIETLHRLTKSPTIVRAMPNLAAKIQKGFTGWVSSAQTAPKERAFAKELFVAVGEEMELPQESMIDTIGALSGSGPAYFFLLAEILASKAVAEGFTPDEAARIARQTLIGSGALLESDPRTPAQLRAAVSSRGGTTLAALQSFQDDHVEDLFFTGMDRAIARARELNQ